MDKTNVIDMQGIVKRYYVGQPNELEILHGIDLHVSQNEFVAIVGESGSGKSTLMNMIGALDRPTEGTYRLVGQDISQLKDEQLSDIRNQECCAKCRDSAYVCQYAAKTAQRARDGTACNGWHGRPCRS